MEKKKLSLPKQIGIALLLGAHCHHRVLCIYAINPALNRVNPFVADSKFHRQTHGDIKL